MSRCPASATSFKATELSTPPDNNTAIFTFGLSRSQVASLLGDARGVKRWKPSGRDPKRRTGARLCEPQHVASRYAPVLEKPLLVTERHRPALRNFAGRHFRSHPILQFRLDTCASARHSDRHSNRTILCAHFWSASTAARNPRRSSSWTPIAPRSSPPLRKRMI